MANDIVREEIPKFQKRIGDWVAQGSNNTIVILGTDRPSTIDSGFGSIDSSNDGKAAGTLHFIAGRQSQDGNPDLRRDSAYLYLSQKSSPDFNLDIQGLGKNAIASPTAILKSDAIRIISNRDFKVVQEKNRYFVLDQENFFLKFGDFTLKIDGRSAEISGGGSRVRIENGKASIDTGSSEISLGSDSVFRTSNLVLAGGAELPWRDLFQAVLTFLATHVHPTSVGPSGPSLPASLIPVQNSFSRWIASATR